MKFPAEGSPAGTSRQQKEAYVVYMAGTVCTCPTMRTRAMPAFSPMCCCQGPLGHMRETCSKFDSSCVVDWPAVYLGRNDWCVAPLQPNLLFPQAAWHSGARSPTATALDTDTSAPCPPPPPGRKLTRLDLQSNCCCIIVSRQVESDTPKRSLSAGMHTSRKQQTISRPFGLHRFAATSPERHSGSAAELERSACRAEGVAPRAFSGGLWTSTPGMCALLVCRTYLQALRARVQH